MTLATEAAYTCPACFESSSITVDPSGGRHQRFVEDCPVCCRPIEFDVTLDREGYPTLERVELAA